MSALSAQENFDLACSKYENAKDIINELSTLAQIDNPVFSFETAMRQFDWILQAILLNVSIVDGYYLAAENDFIQKITDYGDILNFFNSENKKSGSDFPELSWENLEGILDGLDEDTRDYLITKISACSVVASEDFVKVFAPIDATTVRNYIEELDEIIALITTTFAAVDGDDIDELDDLSSDISREFIEGLVTRDILLSNKWKELKNNSHPHQSSAPSSDNSLKANFIKKKTLM